MTPADILPQITTLFNPDVWTITANPLGVRIEHKGEPLVFDVTEERVAMTTTLRPASSLRWRGPQTDRRLCDGDPVEALLTLASAELCAHILHTVHHIHHGLFLTAEITFDLPSTVCSGLCSSIYCLTKVLETGN